MSGLTVAYMTNRRDCRFEWFFDSLANQMTSDPVRLVIVDFFYDEPGRKDYFISRFAKHPNLAGMDLIHVPPKPCIWQGRHRVTKQDYFAASNARNTALCYALDGYIAYVDDLSVLLPGWLARVRKAIEGYYVACGSYEKVQKMVVNDGFATSGNYTVHGMDHRIVHSQKMFNGKSMPELIPHTGSWLFGCSLAAPVQAFLDINGWDEDCDSMGAEDYPCGWMLHSAGYKLFFDPAMKTLESEELHFVEPPFLRIDKQNVMGKKDASNAYLAMLNGGRKKAPNYFGPEGLAGLRKKILAGEPFPIPQIPEHDWRDGQLISEM